jgi:hypothetical protein
MTTRSAKNGNCEATDLSRHEVNPRREDVDGRDKPGHDGRLQER